MNIVIGTSIGSATLTYEIIAVFGYLTFGSTVGANIIAMYPSTSLFVAFGQLAIAILVLFSYPLQLHPCRNCLDKVFGFRKAGKGKTGKKMLVEEEEEEATVVDERTVEEEEEDEVVDEDHAGAEMSTVKHTLLTAGIIASGFTTAYFVDDLQMGVSFSLKVDAVRD